MEDRKIQCKVCNLGCNIKIDKINDEFQIIGNRCNRGKEFVLKTIEEPDRIITGRALLKNGSMSRVPVKSTDIIPSELIDEIMEIIKETVVYAPVNKGDIVIKNVLNTGVDIVTQRKVT